MRTPSSSAKQKSWLSKLIILCVIFTVLPSLARDTKLSGSYQTLFEKDSQSSYILVFAYPSAAYLDWSNPSALTKTTALSQASKQLFGRPSSIGHAQFAWSCKTPDGKTISGASGQSGQDNGQGLSGVLDGWGLSLLELVYTDGSIENTEDVESRIIKGVSTGQFSWVGFKVPAENCIQMAQYVKDYIAAEAYKNYGFPVDPLKFEGGGCTSYANAALEKSGLDLPFREAWVRHYQLPKAYMGRTDKLPVYTAIVPQAKIPKETQHVDLMQFLTQDVQWAQPGEPNAIPFYYYDPELFYESFLHLENHFLAELQKPLKPATRTEGLDTFQTQLKLSVDAWYETLKAQNRAFEQDAIHGVTGVIIDLR